jgi:processive 1,2-diacylglycerol beta-glucosyltransferase
MSERPKILILSASVGNGHNQAAAAVKESLTAEYLAEVELVDCLGEGNQYLSKIIKGAYYKTIQIFPEVYDYFYRYTDVSRYAAVPIKSLLYHTMEQNILDLVERFEPQGLVFTHPFPCAAAAGLKRLNKLSLPIIGVVTDFAVHRLWQYSEVDHYCVASTPLAVQMATRGFLAKKIHATGIPVHKGFVQRSSCPRSGEVLVMSGGLGMGPTSDVVSVLSSLSSIKHITVVCGKNVDLQEQMSKTYAGQAVCVLGFTPDIDKLMAEASLLVTKPGALTASEALCSGLPLLLVDALGGQEEENASYLVGSGVALLARDIADVARLADVFLSQPALQEAMRNQCRLESKPRSASIVAELIVKVTQQVVPSSESVAGNYVAAEDSGRLSKFS